MQSQICQGIRRAELTWQRGQGLAEYGLILVLIAVAATAVLSVLGGSVSSLYSYASATFP